MLLEFYGWTEQQLLEALFKAQSDVARGSAVSTFGNESGSTGVAVQLAAQERVIKLQRALYEIDNDRYGLFEHCGQNRTTPVFSTSSRAY